MSDETRLTPTEWLHLTGVVILDPDGWDRRDFERDWERPLTRKEFVAKAQLSTIQDPRGEVAR